MGCGVGVGRGIGCKRKLLELEVTGRAAMTGPRAPNAEPRGPEPPFALWDARGALECQPTTWPPPTWPPPKPPWPPPCCARATGACRQAAASKQIVLMKIFRPELRNSISLRIETERKLRAIPLPSLRLHRKPPGSAPSEIEGSRGLSPILFSLDARNNSPVGPGLPRQTPKDRSLPGAPVPRLTNNAS